MGLLASLSDLVTKKALKFVLKRNFGKYLANELDQDSLDVQLGKGSIELKRLLLNCAQLNADLKSPYWEITEGFIGNIQAKIPIASLGIESCHVVVHEVLMTVKPTSLHHPDLPTVDASIQHQSPLQADSELDNLDFGQATISDGIMQIAGGIENIVQQLQLHASKVTVKLELPSIKEPQRPPSLIMLHLDSLSYAGQANPSLNATVTEPETALTLRKQITFEGLRVELFEAFNDPIAAAENELLESQMHEAQMQQHAETHETDAFELLQHASHVSDTSSIAENDNRHVVICSSDGVGCQGQIALHLTWHTVKQLHPHIAVNLDLHPFQIQLHPHHLPLLSKVADCLKESAQQAQHAQQIQKQAAGVLNRSNEASLVASTRNFIESFALPDCERMAADALAWNLNREPTAHNLYSSPYQSSFQSAAAYPADLHSMHSMADSNSNVRSSAFHDAQSMMGSMTTTFSSFVTNTAASLGSSQTLPACFSSHRSGYGQPQGQPSGQGRLIPTEQGPSPGDGPLGWEMTASCNEASLVLWYPEVRSEESDQDFAMPLDADYRARFCIETGGLDMTVTAINDNAVKCELGIYRLECAEHLPVSGSDAAPAAATLAEISKLPGMLPPCGRGARPLPSFTGVSPVPLTHSLYSSTLSQLASASYMSESGVRPTPFAANTSQVQIWPVMCAGGTGIKSPGITPSLQLSVNLQTQSPGQAPRATVGLSGGHSPASRPNSATAGGSSGDQAATAVAEIKLRPASVWISLPLLQRLQAFLEPLTNPDLSSLVTNHRRGNAQQASAASHSNTGMHILTDLQDLHGNHAQGRAEAKSPLQVSVQAPHVCVMVILPPSAAASGPVQHANGYMAIDIFAAASQELSAQMQHPMLLLKAVPQTKPAPSRGTSRTAPAGPDTWDLDVTVGRAKAYLVARSSLDQSEFNGMGNGHLEAHGILDILPAPECSHPQQACSELSAQTGLTATVTVTPGICLVPDIVGRVWDGVSQHARSSQGLDSNAMQDQQLNAVHLEQDCMASSGVKIHCKAPNMQATISQGDLAALSGLAGAISAWQAETRSASLIPVDELVPMQMSVLLDCRLQVSLMSGTEVTPDAVSQMPHFTAGIAEMQLLNVSSLGGVMDCGHLAVQAQGVTLRGQDRGCLLYCPAEGPSTSSASSPAVEFWQVSRPCSLQNSTLDPPQAGQPAQLASHEGHSSALVRGTTFSTYKGDLKLSWLTELASFFAVGVTPNEGQGVGAQAPYGSHGGAVQTPNGSQDISAQSATPQTVGIQDMNQHGAGSKAVPLVTAMGYSVALQDVALRYEPSTQHMLREHSPDHPRDDNRHQFCTGDRMQQSAHARQQHLGQSHMTNQSSGARQTAQHQHQHRQAQQQHQSGAVQQRQDMSSLLQHAHSAAGGTDDSSNQLPVGDPLLPDSTELRPDSHQHHNLDSQVSAVLTLAGLQWGLQTGDESQQVCLQCISLYCADSALQQGPWGLTDPISITTAHLAESGYGLVTQEAQLTIALKPPQEPMDFFQTEVTNQHLGITVSKPQLQMLTRLANQFTSQQAQSQPSSASDDSSLQRSSLDDPAAVSHSANAQLGAVERQESASSGQLQVMDGVQEDAFRREFSSPAASVFLEGRWFANHEAEKPDLTSSIVNVDPRMDQDPAESIPSSLPQVTENYILPSTPSVEAFDDWQDESSNTERAVWYGNQDNLEAAGPNMQENYVQQPSPTRLQTHDAQTGALGALPEGYPRPLSRLVLRNLKVLITLNQEAESQADAAAQSEPNNGRLEVDLEGVCLQLDSFDKSADSTYAWRLAFSVHQLEVRDHMKKSKGRPARWRRMLGYHYKPQTLRHPSAHMLKVELDAVRPDAAGKPQQEDEYRLAVAVLPLRLRLHQSTIAFLQDFFAAPATPPCTQQKPAGNIMFLQKADIQSFSLMVDYQPRSLDAAALRSGSFMEVLNLVPWGGVQLELPAVRAAGLQGWDALGSAAGNAYLQDIASSQVHKFVVGVAPVRSLCRVGWAAKQLLAIPADQLRGNSPAYAGNIDVTAARQLRRGVTALARAVTLEALGLGASVAGGADYVLRGGSGVRPEQPAGFKEGLKQAAQGLSSGLETAASKLVYSPVRSVKDGEGVSTAVVRAVRNAPGAIAAPVAAAAAATRATFLGVRNAIDPERYEQRSR